MSAKFLEVRSELVSDLAKHPEFRAVERWSTAIAVLLAVALFAFGHMCERFAPELNTSGMQMLVWGGFISTTLVYHCTFSINSLMHMWGKRRFETPDTSRNNFVLALLTLGEGWHNNHHHYPTSVRQGLYWWEVDFTYYVLKLLSWIGIVWGLRYPLASPGDLKAERHIAATIE